MTPPPAENGHAELEEEPPIRPCECLFIQDYRTGIFGCLSDPPVWLFSCCCTPLAIGRVNGVMQGRAWSFSVPKWGLAGCD